MDAGRTMRSFFVTLLVFELENLLDGDTKNPSKPKGQFNRRFVPASFDRDDGLTGHPNLVGKLLLRHSFLLQTVAFEMDLHSFRSSDGFM